MKKRFFFSLLSLSLPNSSPLLHHISPVRFLVVRKIESANALTALRKFDFLPWAKLLLLLLLCARPTIRQRNTVVHTITRRKEQKKTIQRWRRRREITTTENYFHLNDIWSFVYSEQRAYIVKSPCKMREMSYRYISIVLNIYQTRWSEPQWKIITKQCRIHHYYYYWSFWALVRFFLLIRRLPRPCEPITNNA